MPSDTNFEHELAISDACCLINLEASGYAAEILNSIPVSVTIAPFVKGEAMSVDLPPLLLSGLLVDTSLQSEEEEELLVSLAAEGLQNGEAEAGAIAITRGWILFTDERLATKVIKSRASHIQLLSTPHLLKHWTDSVGMSTHDIGQILHAIQTRGSYRPKMTHPLFPWWEVCIGS